MNRNTVNAVMIGKIRMSIRMEKGKAKTTPTPALRRHKRQYPRTSVCSSHSRRLLPCPGAWVTGSLMDEQHDAGHYKALIDAAGSYHDLVVMRSRFFALMERTLSKEDCQAVKDHWQAKAKDESLPIAPPSKG